VHSVVVDRSGGWRVEEGYLARTKLGDTSVLFIGAVHNAHTITHKIRHKNNATSLHAIVGARIR
jgi:hypothetical protein